MAIGDPNWPQSGAVASVAHWPDERGGIIVTLEISLLLFCIISCSVVLIALFSLLYLYSRALY